MQFLIEMTLELLQSFDVFDQTDLKLDLEEAGIDRKITKISAARGCAPSTKSICSISGNHLAEDHQFSTGPGG
jgi:hypothetical protein